MKKLTYKEAYNKIIDAYFKDEIKPLDTNYCFCGTLSPNRGWDFQLNDCEYPYSRTEYRRMELALLDKLSDCKIVSKKGVYSFFPSHSYEKKLFSGMCAALEVLKQIHKDRGENVDEETTFTKRVLTT